MATLERPGKIADAATIRALFTTFQAANPHPTTELAYGNTYQLLIAVVMSAQTTDVAVNKATAAFFPHITTPAQMVAWGEENLANAIRTIGLYRTKAKYVLELSRQLVATHNGEVPHDLTALQKLPGVGLKTASVVANTVWGAPLVAVYTHVFRVARRLGLSRAVNTEKMAAELPQRLPDAFVQHAHHWLILHGRYTCKAVKPLCAQCPVYNFCHSPVKNTANTLKVNEKQNS